MRRNIFDECKSAHEDDCIDLADPDAKLTVDEILDGIWEEHVEAEIYRVKVLRNPRQGKKEIIFPERGFLRYIPGIEIQFWSFPGDNDSPLDLKDLLYYRADRYGAGIIKDDVWQLMSWPQEGTSDPGDATVNYMNSGIIISLWFDDGHDQGLVLQILGLG